MRGGGSGGPAASPRAGCAAPPGRAAGCRSPHRAHAPSPVPAPRHTTLEITSDRPPHRAHAPHPFQRLDIQLFRSPRIGLLTAPTRLHPFQRLDIQLFRSPRIGLLTAPTRLHPFQRLDIQLFRSPRIGLLTVPTRLQPFQCLDIQLFGHRTS